jgi:hypothetical protein
MGLSGKGTSKKIEFRLLNFNDEEVGRFVFKDLPSWSSDDDSLLLEEWKKELDTSGISGRKRRSVNISP